MHDPMREAIKHRRSHGLDLSKILGDKSDPAQNMDNAKLDSQPGAHASINDESKGDLAPEAESAQKDSANDSEAHLAEHGDQSPNQRKAIHASEDHKLEGSVAMADAHNPEHEPIERADRNDQNQFGHEISGRDSDFETLMSAGHENDTARTPRTLGARVRAALHGKKGK